MNISILSYINGKYNNAGCEYEIGNGQTAELSVDVKSESEDITYDWQKYDTDEYCYVSTGKQKILILQSQLLLKVDICVLLHVMAMRRRKNLFLKLKRKKNLMMV